MEGLIGTLIAVVVGQFSLLWYKLGKMEQKLKALNELLHNSKKGGK